MSRYDDPTDPVVVRGQVRHFKRHLLSYIVVVGMLAAINLLTGGITDGNWWFLWVALFWGIGLLFHAFNLFGDGIGMSWEDRMVETVLARRRSRMSPQASATYQPPEPPVP